jgi:hypothetical protein
VEGEEHLNKYITNYYKGLFGEAERSNLSLNDSMVEDIPQISPMENEFLETEFSEKEVGEAVFQMEHNKAPGPDGFSAEFYQVFWNLIKDDLMAMYRDFHVGNLPIICLNFGIITLLPKEQ